jgi:hypothetical protein
LILEIAKSQMNQGFVFLGGVQVLVFELRAYTLSHSTSPIFVMVFLVFFEIGLCKLFSWVGFEWRSF